MTLTTPHHLVTKPRMSDALLAPSRYAVMALTGTILRVYFISLQVLASQCCVLNRQTNPLLD